MDEHYDVVVVGARCAGATFATFMARAGAKVLLIDRAPLPSDVVLSTHTVHPSGMAVLDELGVGEAIRQVTPEMTSLRLDWNGAVLDIPFASRHGEYCPRRKRLDHLLQQTARDAGAELRDKTQAVGLLREGERVVGVELSDENTQRRRVYAPWIVGADGRNSKIGEWVGARFYYDYEPPRGMYWSYWHAPRGWGKEEPYTGGMYVCRRGLRLYIAFHTDDDCVLLGTLPLRSQIAEFRSAPLASLRAALSMNPRLAPLVVSDPVERPRGYLGERYFFRQPVGAGWLLLGDAGLHKDFFSGDGISEALLQARNCAQALLGDGGPLSTERRLVRWALQRDIDALPDYRNTQALVADTSPGELNRVIFPKVAARPKLQQAFADTFSRKCSPFEMIPAWQVLPWMLGALLEGRLQVLREFAARARLVAAVQREQHRLRRQLLSVAVGGNTQVPAEFQEH